MRRALGLLFLALVLISGCGDAYPIEDLGFVTLIAVDGEPGHIKFTAQLINPVNLPGGATSMGGGGAEANRIFHKVSGEGPNLYTAVLDADQRSAKRLYFGQLEAVVVTDRLLRAGGLGGVLDYMERGLRIRDIPWIYMTPETDLPKVLETAPTLASYPARGLVSQSIALKTDTIIYPTRVYQVASDVYKAGTNPTLPVLSTNGKDFVIEQVAILKGQRLVGIFSEDAAAGAVWLEGHAAISPFAVPCGGGKGAVTAEAFRPMRSFQAILGQDRELKGLGVEIRSRVHLDQVSGCRVDWNNPTDVNAVMAGASTAILKQVQAALSEAKAAKSDVFGFGEYLRAHHPPVWAKVGPTWNDKGFPNVPIAVRIVVRPDNSGLLRSSVEPE